MTNSDFRKLLATPRAGGGAQGAAAGRRGGGEFKRPAAKPKPKPRPKKPETAGEEKDDSVSAYRDRAKERREEAAPEYQGDQSGAALVGVRGGVPGVTHTDELRQLSIEESKFLGGDVEHTHLVKGLDFALLRKTRAEIAGDAKGRRVRRGGEKRLFASASGRKDKSREPKRDERRSRRSRRSFADRRRASCD
jgi:IK cytokine